ncbi:FG-GAP-like repeat-containing protein [Streptomyces sp. Qhu_M48]|uniref:FG-GAP-like repeat-containing protein n=1 Tax=Streptomyces sp. Qhu_M48 TaxID=3435889 RepID=UPI003F4F70DE
MLLTASMLPGPAVADTVEPATAPPVRTLSYNVCGASSACRSSLDLPTWTAAVKQQVLAWDTDALLLQELCVGQWAALRDALPGYTAVWTETTKADGCAAWSTDRRFGLGVFVKGAEAHSYRANLTTEKEPRAVLCARAPVDGRATLACTTHLDQAIKPDNGSSEALSHIDAWAAGLPVVLGGDLNAGTASAYDPMLDPIRHGRPGTGPFAEADENDREHFTSECLAQAVSQCRSGEPTVVVNAVPKKFDHVFMSARDFHTVRADAFEPRPEGSLPLSDHLMLRAAAHPEPRPGSGVEGDLTGDGRPDFLAVKDDGALRLYSGTGGGGVAQARVIGSGGWAGAAVSHRGDWTGDGREDVLARIGDALWVYPNRGSGELGPRIAMGGRPVGWTNITPFAAGDVDGDALPDVLVRSVTGLWLHRGAPAVDGMPAFAPRATLNIGDPEWAGFDVLLPGDVTGDGRPDVWGRDRADGTLRQYAGRGNQHLADGTGLTGGPFTVADRRLAVSSGDVTGDGFADLWTTRTSGTAENLEFLPGTATGPGTPSTVGTGGWQWQASLG